MLIPFLISLGFILAICYLWSKDKPIGWLLVGVFSIFAGLGIKVSELMK